MNLAMYLLIFLLDKTVYKPYILIMKAKIHVMGLMCLFIFISCDKLKNPYSDYSFNPHPVISITISDLTSTYNSELDRWSWEFQVTLTESNGFSATITELMARVYYNRSWPLGETVYDNHYFLPANDTLFYDVAIFSGKNVDRIKVFFKAEDEDRNYFEGAENFHLGNSNVYDDKL